MASMSVISESFRGVAAHLKQALNIAVKALNRSSKINKKDQGKMEESSRKEEEVEIAVERNAIFYLCHPCYLFQQALNHLIFKCFGFEIGTNRKHSTSSLVNKPPSESEEDHINPQSNATSGQKCSEEVTSSSAEAAVDQECNSATQGYDELTITSVMLVRGRPGLSSGSGPQNN